MQRLPGPLPQAKGQHHWSVEECFRPGMARVKEFLHRDYAIGMHTQGFIEVNIISAGQGWHHLEEQVFAVAAGDAFVIPEGARHGYERRGRLDVQHLLLHPQYVAEHLHRLLAVPGFLQLFTVEPFFRAEEGVRHRLRLDRATTTELVRLLASITKVSNRSPAAILTAEALALAALARLCQAWSDDHPGSTATSPRLNAVLAVIDTIEQRFAETLPLSDLARAADLTPSACCRLFRTVTGTTPMVHLRQVRLRHAGVLLRSGLPLAEVATRTGFYDAAHLARVHRRILGITAASLRRGEA
ncbi:hypothetical protein LBMAG53_09220 [Planctomycetota bacterium]|nr:hypothetical protein LBMAG53_09220 [Planctomycetota bacterium]